MCTPGTGKEKRRPLSGSRYGRSAPEKSVYVGQFVKSMAYHETKIAEMFDKLRIEQLGRGCFIREEPEHRPISGWPAKDWTNAPR